MPANGFNAYNTTDFAIPVGMFGQTLVAYGGTAPNYSFYNFDFATSSVSVVPWNYTVLTPPPFPAADPLYLHFAGLDALGNLWVQQSYFLSGHVPVILTQAISCTTGNAVYSGSDQLTGVDTTGDTGVPFLFGNQAHIAAWDEEFNTLPVPTLAGVILRVFNVSTSVPVLVGSITFTPDWENGSDMMNGEVFFDGVDSLWVMQNSENPLNSAILTSATLYKLHFPSMAIVGSLSFSGVYGFVGDPSNKHVYVLGADGTVFDVDTTLTVVASYSLGATISAPGAVGFSGSPVSQTWATSMMTNSTYGTSVDPCTGQFFLAHNTVVVGSYSGRTFTRVQAFGAIDTLSQFIDWGANYSDGYLPLWVPSRQSVGTAGGPPGTLFFEFLYTALTCPTGVVGNPFANCTGVEFQ